MPPAKTSAASHCRRELGAIAIVYGRRELGCDIRVGIGLW